MSGVNLQRFTCTLIAQFISFNLSCFVPLVSMHVHCISKSVLDLNSLLIVLHQCLFLVLLIRWISENNYRNSIINVLHYLFVVHKEMKDPEDKIMDWGVHVIWRVSHINRECQWDFVNYMRMPQVMSTIYYSALQQKLRKVKLKDGQ